MTRPTLRHRQALDRWARSRVDYREGGLDRMLVALCILVAAGTFALLYFGGRAMTVRGEVHGRAKLTAWDVAAIRLVLDEPAPPSVSAVAKAFDVDRRTVRRARDGRAWGWL